MDPLALTPREEHVLALRGDGLSLEEIAAVLGVKAHTIGKVLAAIREKTGATDLAPVADPALGQGPAAYQPALLADPREHELVLAIVEAERHPARRERLVSELFALRRPGLVTVRELWP